MMRRLAIIICAVLSACSAAPEPHYFASENPERLSDWGQVIVQSGEFSPTEGVLAYDLNTPLFSDYAGKLRTVWISGGDAATYADSEVFDFPVGTVISKTFYYEKGENPDQVKKTASMADLSAALDLNTHRLMETRLLVRRAEGWDALPYVWNDAQTEAYFQRTGDVTKLALMSDGEAEEFAYIVPNTNQCAGCHATDSSARAIQPIGPKARHLNRDIVNAGIKINQLASWKTQGLLGDFTDNAPANANWMDVNASLKDRARAYIDINCSHCHSETGPADTSGLHLTPDTPMGPHLGLCKTPIAAGRGTGNREFGIVPGKADRSIFAYRMASTDPGIMMPEVGRALVHDEGVALVAEWINALNGHCGRKG